MSTILFDRIVFGPIHSRRLGISLGVNLLPTDGKICSFDCIYCECGYNNQGKGTTGFPTQAQVKAALETKLQALQRENTTPDVITFAGNGEPTLHPDFGNIIDDTVELRNCYFPNAKISVLSNGTMVHKPTVFSALLKVDNNILKLDSAIESTVMLLNAPRKGSYLLSEIIALYRRFEGAMILQTMFTKGMHCGQHIDNTTDEEVNAWLEAVKQIAPSQVMIYTIDRETPEKQLGKISLDKLNAIADCVKHMGIAVSVAG